ncbi:hypothetical protein O5477_27035, partial [Escherichia coli]|nr:hypothetical protein [Escherichia coli]
ATRRRVGARKIREEKQKKVTASETRINLINADITQIQKSISQVSNNRNAGISRVHEAEENLTAGLLQVRLPERLRLWSVSG